MKITSTNKKTLLSYFYILFLTSVSAQKIEITGIVYDEQQTPLPGVTIYEENAKNSTITDFDGNFSIVSNIETKLIFQYLGYQTFTYIVKAGKQNLKINLQPEVNQLEELVIIGYGEVKRKDLTGATSSVKTEELTIAPVASIDAALTGRVAGVNIVSSEGKPGSSSSIKIRGTGSLTQDTSPLFVIDGFPIEDFDLSSLPQADVESMEILKGPSAIAIYGARAGNGVIIIKTKSGVKGKVQATYNGFIGYENISNKMVVLTPYEFVGLRYEIDESSAYSNYGDIERYLKKDGTSVNGIDWQKETFRQTELKSHNFSLNGGTETTKYNFTYSNYATDGLIKNSGFKRDYLKVYFDQKVNKKLRVNTNITYSKTKTYGAHTSTNIVNLDPSSDKSSSSRLNLLKDIIQSRPTGGLFTSNEELLYLPVDLDADPEGSTTNNPLVSAQSIQRDNIVQNIQFNGSLNYTFTKGLFLKVLAGIRKSFGRKNAFDDKNSLAARRAGGTRGLITLTENTNLLFSSTLNYNVTLKRVHKINSLFGFDYQDKLSQGSSSGANNFPEPNLGLDDLGMGTIPNGISSFKQPTNKLISYFTRVNYTLDSKYLFTGTLRLDGSSRFGANKKFGLFPSTSFAWRMSQEEFLINNTVISEAKLRAEWGRVGVNRIPPLVSEAVYEGNSYGVENGTASGVYPTNIANKDIQWETQEQINFGLDLYLFDDRLTFIGDVYRKNSIDLLLQAPSPASSGATSIYKNIGEIRNEGLELTLGGIIFDNEFKWNSNLAMTFPRNKTLKLINSDVLLSNSSWSINNPAADDYAGDFITQVGQPFGLMYGLIDDGLYRSDDFDQDGNPHTTTMFSNNIEAGFRKYVDVNKDGHIDNEDKVVIGNPNPDFFGSLNNNFSYKNFDLNVFFQWSYGNDIYNANRILWTSNLTNNRNFISEINNRWHTNKTAEENSNATFRSYKDQSKVLTSAYIEDGSYIRLKTVQLAYNLPKKWLNNSGISKLRFYVSGQNLITWTNYTGFDPEVSTRGNGLTSGVDFGAYPRTKTFVGGLTISF